MVFLGKALIMSSFCKKSYTIFDIVYLNTIAGFLTNAILDIPLMILFHNIGVEAYYGAIVATILGYIISFYLALSSLKRELNFSYKNIMNIIKKQISALLGMCITLYLLHFLVPITSVSTLNILIVCIIYALVGGIVYFVITYKNDLLYDVFGKEYVDKILNKIKKVFRRR